MRKRKLDHTGPPSPRRTLFLFAAGAVLLAGGLIVLSIFSARPKMEVTTLPTRGSMKGMATAPVTIVEFADFQCVHCADFATSTLKRLEREYIATGKAKILFRHYPLLGQESEWAALGAECAAEQGRFWSFHDLLFRVRRGVNQGAFLPARLLVYAKDLGLDQDAFRACLEAGRAVEKIKEDVQEGLKQGVEGTPTFVIEGRKIVGNQPFEVFQEAIEEALSQVK